MTEKELDILCGCMFVALQEAQLCNNIISAEMHKKRLTMSGKQKQMVKSILHHSKMLHSYLDRITDFGAQVCVPDRTLISATDGMMYDANYNIYFKLRLENALQSDPEAHIKLDSYMKILSKKPTISEDLIQKFVYK